MTRVEIAELEPGSAVGTMDSLAPVAPTSWERSLLRPHHPFLEYGSWRLFLVIRDGRPAARAIAAVDSRQTSGAGQVGTIGFLAHDGDLGGLELAIGRAEAWLAESGARVGRCPVQFSTWFGHRLGLDGIADSSCFAMEPAPAPEVAELLERRGYVAAHRAVSHLVSNDRAIAGARRGPRRLQVSGFRERALDRDGLEADVDAIYRVATAAFRTSWGNSEISPCEFRALYLPVARAADPELVRLIESPLGEVVGFAFAFGERVAGRSCRAGDGAPRSTPGRPPHALEAAATIEPTDIVDAARLRRDEVDIMDTTTVGEDGDSRRRESGFVLKSLAVTPRVAAETPGLGLALVARLHELAEERGWHFGIHALTTQGSSTHKVSARWGKQIRSYATFERALSGGRP